MIYTAKKTKVKPTNTVKCNNCFKEICKCDNCDEYFVEEQDIICVNTDSIFNLHFCNYECYEEFYEEYKRYINEI